MSTRVALFLSALLAVFALSTASAWALPGDPGVASVAPFRLDAGLEPSAYLANSPATPFVHVTLLPGGREAHVKVDSGAGRKVDQVLIPRAPGILPGAVAGGYVIYDHFTVNGSQQDSIFADETGTNLFASAYANGNPGIIDLNHVVVVVSSDNQSAQNEPYLQEANGIVSAKNRPIITPIVSALGVSALTDLNTYKIGFGYSTSWYSAPAFLPFFVTDQNAVAPFAGGVPAFVLAAPRTDGVYDARRVNDVDKAGESWTMPGAADGQTFLFAHAGDSTAWLDSNTTGLLTTLTQGDLPISWTVRASLAPASYERGLSFTEAQLRAWENEWFLYLAGKGAHPALPLAPGTNSPVYDGRYGLQVQPSETRSASGAAQTQVSSTAQSAVKGATATSVRAILRSAKIVRVSGKRMVRVFVRSPKATARIEIRMYSAKGHLVRKVTKTVKTNRAVRVAGVIVGSKVKTVKVRIVG